jgi:hypothetical protein
MEELHHLDESQVRIGHAHRRHRHPRCVRRQQDRRDREALEPARVLRVGEERDRPRSRLLDRRDAADLDRAVAVERPADARRDLGKPHAARL